MSKIAVIGDRESILGYKAVGFDVYEQTSFQEASRLLHRIAKEDVAVIFITEDLYRNMESAVSRYADQPTPAIIPLPGKNGADGSGMEAITRAVQRAVGSDIVK